MGEESGVPVGLSFSFFWLSLFLPCSEEKRKRQRRGCLHGMLFTSIQVRSRGGEKEELQDTGIYTLLSQILTFEYKKSVGLSCL